MKFEELNIPEQVLDGIRAAGFSECTPVQALSLPIVLSGRDVAAQAQTGTGKTAAFLIGIFSRMLGMSRRQHGVSPQVLIIAPTRELVVQIDAEAQVLGKACGFTILSVFGGIDYEKQRTQLAAGVDVLIGTPGRLIDYLKQHVYNLKETRFLVIDEADRMFDMGFISDLRFMLRRMAPYHKRQSMLFSATLTTRVLELCYEHMNNPERIMVTPEQVTVEKIRQEIYHVSRSEKNGLLLGILRRESGGRYLIFCNMKSTADKVKELLRANGFSAAAITGDLDQKKRLRVLSQFKGGELPILVATDVAGRGLHIEGVTHVINYDLPQDADDYVHRIGRTARAGASGKAVSLACEEHVLSLHDIEEYIKQKIPVVPLQDEMIITDYQRPHLHKRERGGRPGERKRTSPVAKKGMRQGHPAKRKETSSAPSHPKPATVKDKPNRSRRKRRKGRGPGQQGISGTPS